MTQKTAVGNMVLEKASMNVDVDVVNVNVNANVNVNVNVNTPPSSNTGLSADSDSKLSSGSRNKNLHLWVALVVALMVAVVYGVAVAVAVDMGDSGKSVQASCFFLSNIRVAIAYDHSFCANFGGADGARREVERIVAMASTSWYSRPGLCLQLQLVNLEGHCNSGSDPYYLGDIESGCNEDGMLDYFGNYWDAHRRNVSRDAAHLFRTRSFTSEPAIGCAYERSFSEGFAYGVNAFPPYLTAVRRAFVFAHELGHNLGAADIDTTAGESIMRLRNSRGTDGFSQASKDEILNYINSVSCIGSVAAPAPPGDCGNGDLCRDQAHDR